MKLKWVTEPSGFGWNYHRSGDYCCEPYDLDFGQWEAFFAGESLGGGTWRECRALCQAHADRSGK